MLYFVATPIGNLKEITLRAIEVLKESDMIFAEDTRHSITLLNHYDIKKPLYSYQKFNEKQKVSQIIDALKSGKTVSVISDAGMPLISDPGSILVTELITENLEYTVVSGACAAINAVVLSGLSTESFCMCGFLPQKTSKRKEYIESFKNLKSTLIFYSPPHDVADDLSTLAEVLGARKASVVREISKKFEQVIRGTLGSFPDFTLKGEMVIVVEGAKDLPLDETLSILSELQILVDKGMDKKDAIKQVAKRRGLNKDVVYKEGLNL